MKQIVVYLVVLVSVLLLIPLQVISGVGWEDISRGNTRLSCVLVNPQNYRVIYLGSQRGILKSEDAGASWRSVLPVWGRGKAVNLLLFDPQNKNSIYAATQNGLYFSDASGKNWQRIFQGRGSMERDCTSLAVTAEAIYLGTRAGLFVSGDHGRLWQKESGEMGKSSVLSIVNAANYVYAATTDGVFKTSGKGWERVFAAEAGEEENADTNEEELGDYDNEEKSVPIVRYLAADSNNPQHLYLATSRGVYETSNAGRDWIALSDYGLSSEQVSFLSISARSGLYAVSKNGIFRYGGHRWEDLSFGVPAGEINFLGFDSHDTIYAACDKGLFKANREYIADYRRGNIPENYLKDEPDIASVQRVAIKYAEVGPQKIARWRKQAAKRAWFPRLSANVGRNVTDLWHWESGSSTKSADDLLMKGNDTIEWDVGLSWDLGDIIWSEAQTAIDVRSRLTVQLRDDILDEVNKTYFERIRVKMELDNLSIEDRRKRCEKELRLRELTASLDGLTGGYFSQQVKTK